MSMEHDAKEISAVVAAELARCEDERRRMLEALHGTVAFLQRLCDAAIPVHDEQASSVVAHAVERLMAAAAVEAEAAARQAHQEAGMRLADARASLAEREAELRAERAELQMTREKLDSELAARARAEAALQDVHSRLEAARAELSSVKQQLVAAQTERAELSGVKQQLAAAQAERARLLAALEAVQSAVGLVESEGPAPAPAGALLPGGAKEPGVARSDPETSNPETAAPAPARVAPPAGRALKLVSHTPAAPEADPELVEYANSLLDQIEAAYWSDLESARSAVEAVDRLTQNLRTARDLFARRSDSAGCAESPLFRQRLIALLNTRSETSFGRHLAIAAYQLYPIRSQGQAGVALRAS